MQSTARTVAEYLDSLPEDRRREVEAVRRAVRRRLPKGYEEVMNWGMITWQIPLRTLPDTYNGQPLCYAALASQRQYCALYLMGCYAVPAQLARLREAFAAAGRTMDMGKSCLRFTRSTDLPLDAIGELIAELPPAAFAEASARARAARKRARGTSTKTPRAAAPRARSGGRKRT